MDSSEQLGQLERAMTGRSFDRNVRATCAAVLIACTGCLITSMDAQSQGLAIAGVAPVGDAHWAATGSLVARSRHTATLLPNGKVIVVGGHSNVVGGYSEGDDLVTDTAELYDPATGRWSPTGRLNYPRMDHTATLLPDGRILVVGGDQSLSFTDSHEFSNTSELYDPATGAWTLANSMSERRVLHTTTLLRTGKVLVAGGIRDRYSKSQAYLAECELFDPATGIWSRTGSLAKVRASAAAMPLPSGKVLVAGGFPIGQFLDTARTAELYDPDSGAWTRAEDLPVPTALDTATLLRDGDVLLVGGQGGEKTSIVYSSTANKWGAPVWRPASYRVWHSATLRAEGDVLVVGGQDDFGAALDSTESYNPDRDQWDVTAHMMEKRLSHTATLLPDGRILVAGGESDHGNLASAELYEKAGTIGPGYTGSWFDPAQSGHGLFVEVLPNNQLLAAWFTFNPAGTQQAWFIGTGPYTGNTVTVTSVVQPTGGRWIPNFDPNRVVNNAWGTLTFTFTDCNHGKVDFNSTSGYGTGSMNLTRLTQPAGLSC